MKTIGALVGLALAAFLYFVFTPPPEALPPIEGGYPTTMPAVLKGPVVFDAMFGCSWSRPGRDPFTGDENSALAALGLPPETRVAAHKMIAAHAAVDRVRAVNGFVRSVQSRELYDQKIMMTFGEKTICYATFPTFKGEQFGDLYIVDGFHVVIWDVCHNVSRLLPWGEAQEYAASRRPSIIRAVPRTGQPYYPGDEDRLYADRQPRFSPGPLASAESVPEPETWVLFGLGGAILAWSIRKRR